MQVTGREKVPETMGEWAVLRSDGSAQRLELNWYPAASDFFHGPYRNGDELDHITFRCEDVDRAYAELTARGAKPGLAPFDEGGERLAYVADPDGIWVELVSDSTPHV